MGANGPKRFLQKVSKVATVTKNPEDWSNFKRLRNDLNKIQKVEKQNYQRRKMDECVQDSSTTWKNAKSFLGWNSGGPPTKLVQNGKLFTKRNELCKVMNEFFINKVKGLRNSIPVNIGDPLRAVRNIMVNKMCSLKIRCCHPDEVSEIIDKLNKKSKSTGLDNIDTYYSSEKLSSPSYHTHGQSLDPAAMLSIKLEKSQSHSFTQKRREVESQKLPSSCTSSNSEQNCGKGNLLTIGKIL